MNSLLTNWISEETSVFKSCASKSIPGFRGYVKFTDAARKPCSSIAEDLSRYWKLVSASSAYSRGGIREQLSELTGARHLRIASPPPLTRRSCRWR